ncbi:carbohydrate ABC transporter permease [Paenibacillus roseipurpureus]|uniref:Carbohydrate ABC transporter permease n=1 Tax=Paenibacillus roseopurpureus TaxID=2918901 RepID=A0AA96LTP6_9BACL|nr:carbohydrate ABC transporter permease [Paenibacillus sp. MBLB1832]WNR47099.1 carbohydrate ABC transporter permease [Paenibacillus sp. MBLB1832]
MGVFSLLFLIPLFWMVSTSAKVEKDVMVFPIQWIPQQWNWVGNFKTVWMSKVPFALFYFNSLKLAILSTLITLFISAMAAYAFTKLEFKGRDTAFGVLLAFMIIPPEATLVPRYILMKWFHLIDSHAGIVIMNMFAVYFTFLLRQFMLGINQEYMEAAKIDGSGYVRSFLQIILPLSKPILATVAIIKFIWTWNDYQGPLIFIFNQKLYPITLGMQMFKDQYADNYAVMMMASLSAIIPLVIVFIVMQRQVINGITLGGVKG